MHAELWGILHGLNLASSRGDELISVESDSMVALKLVKEGCNKEHPAHQLVHAIHRIAETRSCVLWNHCFHEANQVADALAKHSLDINVD
ncbi:ribonuclease H protein, partial [Trifolium medium]|nr:ribonuclease H protein [Trifolium medium]